MSKNEITFKGRLEKKQALEYLTELVNGMASGQVFVQNGERYVSLTPGRMLDVEIEAVEKKGKEKLSIELSWGIESEPEVDSSLKITTSEPEVRVEEEVEEVSGEASEEQESKTE